MFVLQDLKSRQRSSSEPSSRSSKAVMSSLSKRFPPLSLSFPPFLFPRCSCCRVALVPPDVLTAAVCRSQSGTGKTATFCVSVLQCLDIQVSLLQPRWAWPFQADGLNCYCDTVMRFLSAGEGDAGSDPRSDSRARWTDSKGMPAPRHSWPITCDHMCCFLIGCLHVCTGAARSGRLHERAVSRLHRGHQRGRGHTQA